ncbi:Retinal-specific phospholipid-transporting ATPase ABCA4 [Lamellibrachia satsuma]|nr:Retinal-specific phospholipid-transporting ATPase ABCA4 [Lamellibrachia satsuma]
MGKRGTKGQKPVLPSTTKSGGKTLKEQDCNLQSGSDVVDNLQKNVNNIMLSSVTQLACTSSGSGQLVVVTAYSNFGALHTGATSLNLVDNAILRYFAGSDYSIETTSRPRVQREKKTIYLQALYHKNIWYFVLCITIGIPAIMSSYVFFLVEERVAKTKEMQLISGGVHVFVFWMSNLVFDYMWYMLPIAGIFAVWSAVSGDLVGFDEAASHIALLFALYGWANLPLLYISSLLFDRTGDAFSWLTLYHINTGFVVNYIMAVLGNDEWADSLDAVCLATMPSYCLGRGLYVYVTNLWNTQLCNDENLPINCAMGIRHMCCPETCALTTKCIKFQKDAISLGEGGIGQFLISLATHGLVYITLLLVNDSRVLHVLWYKVTCVGVRDMFSFEPLDDSDVTDEILRRKEQSDEKNLIDDEENTINKCCRSHANSQQNLLEKSNRTRQH